MTTGIFAGTNETAMRLSSVAVALLDFVVAAYADLGVTPPARRYVWTGDDAADGEQLVVSLTRMYTGRVGQEDQTQVCVPTRAADLSVVVRRCIPSVDDGGHAPDAAVLNTAGVGLLTDAWVVRRACEQFTSTLVANKGLGPFEALEAEGGLAGFAQSVGLAIV